MIVTWKRGMWEPRAVRTVMGCSRERMDTSAFSPRWKHYPEPSAQRRRHTENFLSGTSIPSPHASSWARVNYMFITVKCRFSRRTQATERLMIGEQPPNILFWETIRRALGILQAHCLKQKRGGSPVNLIGAALEPKRELMPHYHRFGLTLWSISTFWGKGVVFLALRTPGVVPGLRSKRCSFIAYNI